MPAPSTVLTLGNFDGVHLGHRAILTCARQAAEASSGARDKNRGRVVVLCFDPPPVAVLAPDKVPPQILSMGQRITRLKQAGAHEVVVLEPTADLLAQSAQDFIADLVHQYHPAAIVEGEDFRFGRRRMGDVACLEKLGQQHGFAVHAVPEVRVRLNNGTDAPVRSTLVRQLIGHAQLLDAARCLGEPFSLTATVIPGEQRGRTLGVPTLNLNPDDYAPYILPPLGVYAGMATLEASSPPYPAAISLGQKPTFQGQQLTLEAHLLDFADDVYGQVVTLTFTRFLRDSSAFPTLADLKAQLDRDIQTTRSLHERGMLQA